MPERQQLFAIIDGTNDVKIGETLDGIVSSWSAGATLMFGYTEAEMIGHSMMRIIPAYLEIEETEILKTLERGERIDHYNTVRLAKDGRLVPVCLNNVPLRDAEGNIVDASTIARDVTIHSEVEVLRRTNEALRKANEAAQQARVDAEDASRAKTEFLAVMSHEIRTLLNSVEGFVDLLTGSTALTPQQRRYARLVNTGGQALLTLVNDILEFSRVDSARVDLDPRPFSLRALTNDTLAMIAPAAERKGLKLNCEVERGLPEWVMGDDARLRQILLNLLNNAVKFTDAGSITIEVRSRIAPDGRERICFSVTDTGVGVPAEHHARLFRWFSQAHTSVARKYGGTGLGLAICKRLVEMMGGEIGIESDVGRGSTLWFTVPLPSAEPPPAPAPEPLSRVAYDECADQSARILVVDDVDANLEILGSYLRDDGYHVDCVSSGFEAIRLLGAVNYGLVLMDVQMPFMDGVFAAKLIRALPGPNGTIPIIAMTSNVLPQQIRAFLDAGMTDHVGKPIKRAELHRNIRRWLPTAQSREGVVRPFEDETYNAFVLIAGMDKAMQIAANFLERLSSAFKSNLEVAQQEAHDLINTAGVLGLNDLVRACRNVLDLTPAQEADLGRKVLSDMQRAQLMACQVIRGELLPK